MRKMMFAGAAAALFVATAAGAQTGPAQAVNSQDGFGLTFTTGVDYSTGDYGLADDTDILVVPFSLRATSGPLAFTASLPYLRIDSPGGVVLGPDGRPLPGVPAESGTRSGLGDLTLGANYTLPRMSGFELTLGGRAKLPTAAKSKGLSTGKADFSVSAEGGIELGNASPFVNLGYRFLGDPEGVELRNGPTASVGSSFTLGKAVLITSYDYARASTRAVEDSHELFAGLSVPASDRFTLTGYGIKGLSDGSPDFGAGLLLTTKLR